MDIEKIISEMTLEEKAGMCSGLDYWHLKGVERLGVPSIMITDGPHGLRKQMHDVDMLGINESEPSVCHPAEVAMASSWDRKLLTEIGKRIAKECIAQDVQVILGPGMNIKRQPLCGRNFEYYSEDPCLSSEMGLHFVRGVQSEGVGVSIKHFMANNQEHQRMNSDSIIDDRTLNELYLESFRKAITEGNPSTVMCSYNRINGTYSSENIPVLREVLRDQWGYDGCVITDWGAGHDRIKGIKAGVDIFMPGGNPEYDSAIVDAVEDGRLTEEELNESVRRILRLIDTVQKRRQEGLDFPYDEDHAFTAEAEAECAVLLKNEDDILPLKKEEKILFVGEYAKRPHYQGGGSAHINVKRVTSALEAVDALGCHVEFADGYTETSSEKDEALLQQALQAAKDAGKVVVFAGLPPTLESEGMDRTDMKMPDNQNKLIHELVQVNPNVIVVLHNGSPLELPWADEVPALLEMYLGGENVGTAEIKLLYGEKNPCGKLAETFPYQLEDTPAYMNYPGYDTKVQYNEGVFVGYRYYDKRKMKVRFPFGYGLSYTRFFYSDLTVDTAEIADEGEIHVSLKVTNTGNCYGKEIVQLYIAPETGELPRPVRELKEFTKVGLAPGESKQITFTLSYRAFEAYNPVLADWYAEEGLYEIQVGASSQDIRLQAEVSVKTVREIPFIYTEDSSMGDLMKSASGRRVLGDAICTMVAGMRHMSVAELMKDGRFDEVTGIMMDSMPVSTMATFKVMTKEELETALATVNKHQG